MDVADLVTADGEVLGSPGDHRPEDLLAALIHGGVPVRGFAVTLCLGILTTLAFTLWPVARARLDRHSRASLTVRRYAGVPARVVMVGADWASPLSQSRVFRLARRTPR